MITASDVKKLRSSVSILTPSMNIIFKPLDASKCTTNIDTFQKAFRSKIGSTNLLDITDKGLEELNKLEEEIREDILFFKKNEKLKNFKSIY